ncbi:MAG: endonuclease/exonuclease/phosphatase [Rhodospirillaceae bacterium]|nr:endonuclease/exonuclease/phosphatase [Rhodospirillaceae bacterium]
MATIRVATFNAENLYARYKFDGKGGKGKDGAGFEDLNEKERRLTGLTIKAADADIIALQEVESLAALKKFFTAYVKDKTYTHFAMAEINDSKQQEIAVVSRYPITHTRSHQHEKDGKNPVFTRDCLEVDIEIGKQRNVTLFVVHFKSPTDKSDPCNGRKNTRAVRLREAAKVKQIVQARFGEKPGKTPFIILGDPNDYPESDDQGAPGIEDLIKWDAVVNVVERMSHADRWTHYEAANEACQRPDAFRQLDYILLSKSLADDSPWPPKMVRKGMTTRAWLVMEERFKEVGADRASASSHSPLTMDVSI